MAGAILLWVAVAALSARAMQGHVVALDEARRTLTLETIGGAGPRTFAIPTAVGVQRFDQSLPVGDLRPGQWVEIEVREKVGRGPRVTSIRIIREKHESLMGREP
jgi:hypothetical protein